MLANTERTLAWVLKSGVSTLTITNAVIKKLTGREFDADSEETMIEKYTIEGRARLTEDSAVSLQNSYCQVCRKILERMENRSDVTSGELEKSLGMNQNTVVYHLDHHLRRDGYVEDKICIRDHRKVIGWQLKGKASASIMIEHGVRENLSLATESFAGLRILVNSPVDICVVTGDELVTIQTLGPGTAIAIRPRNRDFTTLEKGGSIIDWSSRGAPRHGLF